MIKKTLPLFLLIFNASIISGQTANSNRPLFPEPVPPAPNAASLGKYGNIPVSKYTGVPDITIPIWQIDEGDITVPISLSYHASGLRVEENASWVGLGWSLNAGGVITRAVRGKPDESGYLLNSVGDAHLTNNLIPNLLINLPSDGFNASACDVLNACYYSHVVATGGMDSEPDIYYFNFNGISGKFVTDQQGNAYTIPFQKIKIEKLPVGGWKITTPDGMQYTFGAIETTLVSNVSYNQIGGVTGDNVTTTPLYPSAWYLSKINSTTGHSVSFNYVREDYTTHSGASQYLLWDVSNTNIFNAANNVVTTGSISQIAGQRLSNIIFSNGRVDFIANKTRQDLDDSGNPNLLEKISVSNQRNVIRNFVLGTDYFTSNDVVQRFNTRRLRLNSITEWGGDMLTAKPPYLFSYDSSAAMPSSVSASQDHWGYYNGKSNTDINNKPTLIPDLKLGLLNVIQELYFNYGSGSTPVQQHYYNQGISLLSYKGADRTPDFNFSKIGVLNKITYPSGGYTAFEFEPNDYDLKPGNYVYSSDQIGIQSSATSSPGASRPGNIIIYDNGNGSYTNTQTMDFSQYINSANGNVNAVVSGEVSFYFINGGRIFYNCGYYEPEGFLIDVTANKTLIHMGGRAAIPPIYLDPEIQGQISAGTLALSGDFNPRPVPPGGDPDVWTSAPYFIFSNVQLNPSHVYMLKTIVYDGLANSCDLPNSATKPVADIYTSAAVGISGTIKTNKISVYNGVVGGLRIKKISDYCNVGQPIVKQYTYRLSSNPKISSGVIEDMPVYFDEGRKNVTNTNAGDPSSGEKGMPLAMPAFISSTNSTFISLSSGSKFELGQTNGNFVGYKEVQESYCADGTCAGTPLGYTRYTFTSPDDFKNVNTAVFGRAFWGDIVGWDCSNILGGSFELRWRSPLTILPTDNIYPYPIKNSYDWKKGLLLSEEYYDSSGILCKKIISSYNTVNDPNNSKVISGLKMVTAPQSRINDVYFSRYDYIVGWNYKTRDEVREFGPNGDSIVTLKNYFYDTPSHGFLTREETSNSRQENLKTTYTYIADLSGQAPYNTMSDRFELNPLVVKSDYNNDNFLASSTTNYSDWGNGIIKPRSVQTIVKTNPVDIRIQFYGYDGVGNLLSASKAGNQQTAYIYDYAKSYPIAEINGADISQVAYSSFEADGNGNWTISSTARTASGVTGNKSYTLSSGNITATIPQTSTTYIVSYWSRNGAASVNSVTATQGASHNGWTYYEHALVAGTTTVTVSGSATIDELRLYPSNAQIVTYSYTPLVGMTSQCDARNVVSYFDYDKLGRLKWIKDQDNNIIKGYDYQYQQLP